MANSTCGNNGAAIFYPNESGGELVDECNVFGYRAITPNASQYASVKIYFYYKPPTSSWYWEESYGEDYRPIVPLVFSCDSNWNLTDLLNASFYEIGLSGRPEGWIELNVTLKRKLCKNERIFFGVYSDILGPIGTHSYDVTGNCYLYYSEFDRAYSNNQIAYVTSSEWIRQSRYVDWYNDMCLFMQYENEINSVAYKRTVIGNVNLKTTDCRSRKTCFRVINNSILFSSQNKRTCKFHLKKNETVKSKESINHLLCILRSCSSNSDLYEQLNHKSIFMREPKSVVSNKELIIRSGENFRNYFEEIEVKARPFASRLFFRTVQTVIGFWDWLRGKIREANNVVNLFTPVVLEITLDGKNMDRIYKGKTKLRVMLDCKCDLSGYASVNIKARKPDDTEVIFPAVIKDEEHGIIFYDVQSENDFDKVGWWTLWPMFVFDDDRTSCGRAQRAFVYEEGT